MRPTQAVIDTEAITENIKKLAAMAPGVQLCCVVKADGYGHGVLPVACAVRDAGVELDTDVWLAVALVEEGMELREGGIDLPILLLSEPSPSEMEEVVASNLRPTIYTKLGLEAAASSAKEPLKVHLKIDTGMHRVGVSPDEAVALAEAIANTKGINLEGVWTHLAVADDSQNSYTARQLKEFNAVLEDLEVAGIKPDLCHVANSAGFINFPELRNFPESRFNMARLGISIYGILPEGVGGASDRDEGAKLEPAMRLTSEVSFVKKVKAGEGISYGHHFRLEEDAHIATVPIGYADGIRRDYGLVGGEVLIRGGHHSVIGTVTMDQLMVRLTDGASAEGNVTAGADIAVGDEVVIIGRQGGEEITAGEVAGRLGTIPYEVVCGIGKRVQREY